ncbi:MAG: hypothetical protein U0469_01325 [Candidatus Paceibacterota bacterium]|jgi:pentose-5-phosphate-3-epimerase
MKIIPAVLEKDFSEIKSKLDFLVKMKDQYSIDFDLVQIDICDGEFVKNKTWIFNPENLEERETLNLYRKYFDLEFHLMTLHQKRHFEEIKKTNAQSAVVHLDSLFENQHDRKYFLDLLLESENSPTHIVYTAKLDTMINNKDNFMDFLKEMKGYQEKLSVQVMGIENIGEQGQNFDERCIKIVKSLRENFDKEELSIQVDGSMIPDHIKSVKEAGADRIIVGSYLLKDLEESIFLNRFKELSEI